MAKKSTTARSATTAAARTAGKAPAASAKKADKKKAGRVTHPALAGDAKLDAVPDDFDPAAHKPLKKSDFADETVFMLFQADQLEARAAALREDVVRIRELGGAKELRQAKKISAMLGKVDELKAQLAEDGVDVAKLLAAITAK